MSHSIPLSRSSQFCGGSVPLLWLVTSLLRRGEVAAATALSLLPLPLTKRVFWTIRGREGSLEVLA